MKERDGGKGEMCETRSGVDKLFDLWATLGSKICQRGLQQEQMDR